ncbi:MAG: enoyl-ACP reductase FabI [Cellulomonadaceae bacterium]|jgi:enoyl-[acyl-carrier protein] reductase I|nr:enoyl-ACP reductase FabI [Cellulomonadaceae bacterium]
MQLLEGKNILVTGIRTDASIAYKVAKIAQESGANVVLSSIPRAMDLTKDAASTLPKEAPVIQLDVCDDADLAALPETLKAAGFDRIDGVVHSIAFAHKTIMGGNMFDNDPEGEWDRIAQAMRTSAYSYKALIAACRPLMPKGSAAVGLTYDSRFAWPDYNWMGVAKACLEAATRYMARDLGRDEITCNLVSAGSIITPAAMGVPGFEEQMAAGSSKIPLPWNAKDATPVAQAVVALLSPWFPMTTGDILYVDGGLHAVNEE